MKTTHLIFLLGLSLLVIGCNPVFTTATANKKLSKIYEDCETCGNCGANKEPAVCQKYQDCISNNDKNSASCDIFKTCNGKNDRNNNICSACQNCNNLQNESYTNYQICKDNEECQTQRKYYLPIGRLILKLERKEDNGPLEITLTPKIVPDLDQPLYLTHKHDKFYDDNFIVETDENGLLKYVSSSNTFKGPEIIKQIGEVASATTKLSIPKTQDHNEKTNNKLTSSAPLPKTTPCERKLSIEIVIDPYKESGEYVKKKLVDSAKNILEVQTWDCIKNIYFSPFPKYKNYQNINAVLPVNSIMYRSGSFDITMRLLYLNQGKDLTVSLPDTQNVQNYMIKRGYLVDRNFMLTFSNGVLVKDESTYPSEGRVIISAINAVLSLPASVINIVGKAVLGGFGLAK